MYPSLYLLTENTTGGWSLANATSSVYGESPLKLLLIQLTTNKMLKTSMLPHLCMESHHQRGQGVEQQAQSRSPETE